jgi:prephenate dehydratase
MIWFLKVKLKDYFRVKKFSIRPIFFYSKYATELFSIKRIINRVENKSINQTRFIVVQFKIRVCREIYFELKILTQFKFTKK